MTDWRICNTVFATVEVVSCSATAVLRVLVYRRRNTALADTYHSVFVANG